VQLQSLVRTAFLVTPSLTSTKKHRSVSFLKKEQPKDLYGGVDDGGYVESPSPSEMLRDHATHDGTQNWTGQNDDAIESYGFASLFSVEKIA
jgi:hypothetical protein